MVWAAPQIRNRTEIGCSKGTARTLAQQYCTKTDDRHIYKENPDFSRPTIYSSTLSPTTRKTLKQIAKLQLKDTVFPQSYNSLCQDQSATPTMAEIAPPLLPEHEQLSTPSEDGTQALAAALANATPTKIPETGVPSVGDTIVAQAQVSDNSAEPETVGPLADPVTNDSWFTDRIDAAIGTVKQIPLADKAYDAVVSHPSGMGKHIELLGQTAYNQLK